MPSPVCIVGGTGALGFGLTLRLAATDTPVVIGSRDRDRAQAAADRVREQLPDADVRGAENPEATRGCELVVITVPFASQAPTLTGLADVLTAEQIVVDATVPLATAVGGKPRHTLGVWQGSAAQQAQALVPDGVRVVSALHTVNAAQLAELDHALGEDVLVCGDRRADRERVAALIERIPGLRAVHAGSLEISRYTEQLTPLLISINVRHTARAGIQITGLDG